MANIVGGKCDAETGGSESATLPYDDPPPNLSFKNKNTVLTGKFESRGRKKVEQIITGLGAKVFPVSTGIERGNCQQHLKKRNSCSSGLSYPSFQWIITLYCRSFK